MNTTAPLPAVAENESDLIGVMVAACQAKLHDAGGTGRGIPAPPADACPVTSAFGVEDGVGRPGDGTRLVIRDTRPD
jgi:hypothetical protein